MTTTQEPLWGLLELQLTMFLGHRTHEGKPDLDKNRRIDAFKIALKTFGRYEIPFFRSKYLQSPEGQR